MLRFPMIEMSEDTKHIIIQEYNKGTSISKIGTIVNVHRKQVQKFFVSDGSP